jgi:outer membrane protein assembly factor BamB
MTRTVRRNHEDKKTRRPRRIPLYETFFVLSVLFLRAFVIPSFAQGRGGANWNAIGADAQRTGWLKTETRISATALQKPGAFQLLWTAKPENQARQLHTLTQPLILGNLISHKGFKSLAFFGGSADVVYAYDYDLGKVYWSHKLSSAAPAAAGTPACPGALTAIARSAPLNPYAPIGGRGPGGAPQSGINPANLPITNAVWAISSGGMVHALNPHVGDDLRTPARIVPSGANVVGSMLVNNILYAATSGACNGSRDGVSALDVSTESAAAAAKRWDSGGATIAGGPAMGLNEVVYVATGAGTGQYANAIVALDAKTLQVRDWFTAAAPFTSAPVAFAQGSRNLVAAAARDGRLYVLDAASPGGADHRTPLARSAVYTSAADFTPGGVTTWQDADGGRWLLVAAAGPIAGDARFAGANGAITNGTVAAFKLSADGAAPALAPGWTSRDLISPSTPIVLNDVVFVVSTGAFRAADAQTPLADRLQRSSPAVLYALDARTGRELWTSGRAITASVQGVGPSGQDGQVYVVAADGTLYAFGIPLEH